MLLGYSISTVEAVSFLKIEVFDNRLVYGRDKKFYDSFFFKNVRKVLPNKSNPFLKNL